VAPFNLSRYLERVAFIGSARPDVQTLRALSRLHVAVIPFENLEIQMGGRITLDPEALQAKMVLRRRGGYCFEHNTLFALALRSIGFAVDTCEARVRQNAQGTLRPRTHMVLTVECAHRAWLADVGFGGDGLIEPIALDGEADEQAGILYRVVTEGQLRVLQRQIHGAWEDLYAVLPHPVYPIDFEVANWYTSTHPRSPFVLNLTVQRVVDGTRHILRNLTYSRARGAELRAREIARGELVPLLRDTFGLDVPEDSRFLALDYHTPTHEPNRDE
jgi:N-hydroxyarylamine O-acetyltransferase